MRRWRPWTSDEGSAPLEFVTLGVLLLVPLVYLIVAVAQIQAGALAVEGAARQAARVVVRAPNAQVAEARLSQAIDITLSDYGVDPEAATARVRCTPHPQRCLERGSLVTITVRARVTLPLLPSALAADIPLTVPVESQASQRVSRFWSGQ